MPRLRHNRQEEESKCIVRQHSEEEGEEEEEEGEKKEEDDKFGVASILILPDLALKLITDSLLTSGRLRLRRCSPSVRNCCGHAGFFRTASGTASEAPAMQSAAEALCCKLANLATLCSACPRIVDILEAGAFCDLKRWVQGCAREVVFVMDVPVVCLSQVSGRPVVCRQPKPPEPDPGQRRTFNRAAYDRKWRRHPAIRALRISVPAHTLPDTCLKPGSRKALRSRLRLLYLGSGTAAAAFIARFPGLERLDIAVEEQGADETMAGHFWEGIKHCLQNYPAIKPATLHTLKLRGVPPAIGQNHDFLRDVFPKVQRL